jgi:hypothetical protein
MSLVILSQTPHRKLLSKDFWKSLLRQLSGRGRGPQAVLASFLRGIKNFSIDYRFNPAEREIKGSDTVWVNWSLDALRWAIRQKQAGKIKRLIAGPNLVVFPSQYRGIIRSPEIDVILEPSEWVRDWYLSEAPELKEKIAVWPSGTEEVANTDTVERDLVLVYDKFPSDKELCRRIREYLDAQGIKNEKIICGRYSFNQYDELLARSKAMIYLSDSESQGLALQEAWARNVPTYVWNRGYMEYQGRRWHDKKISAPYLTEVTGSFFSDIQDFENNFPSFIQGLVRYQPAEYIKNNLSDAKSVEKLLKLIAYV